MQARFAFPDLWNEMSRVHDELNRLFGRVSGNGLRVMAPAGPSVNVWDDEQNVYAQADLPGIDASKLEVFVTDGDTLTIQGERVPQVPENAIWHRQERSFGRFMRQVSLPALVDPDKVEAKYEHGVLYLTMPKSEAAKPRRIAIKA
jgi:HSP20 family protein